MSKCFEENVYFTQSVNFFVFQWNTFCSRYFLMQPYIYRMEWAFGLETLINEKRVERELPDVVIYWRTIDFSLKLCEIA